MTTTRTHAERTFREPGPGECPASHGGMAGITNCELPEGHTGWHRDTYEDGDVWAWEGWSEIAGCIPEGNVGLTIHRETSQCTHG